MLELEALWTLFYFKTVCKIITAYLPLLNFTCKNKDFLVNQLIFCLNIIFDKLHINKNEKSKLQIIGIIPFLVNIPYIENSLHLSKKDMYLF